MLIWLVAIAGGGALAAWLYGWRELPRRAPLAALRAVALALAIALVLDAPAGFRHALPPLVALDVSASWLRGADTALWTKARDRARSLASDSLLLVGDSVRAGRPPALPTDDATRARALAERALGSGRPVVFLTDGEVDDPAALAGFPAGSRIEVLAHPPSRDAAVVSLDAPRATVAGDTIDVRATVRSGALPTPGGSVSALVGARAVARVLLDSLPPRTERDITLRVPVGESVGPTQLAVTVTVPGDVERRNDTLAVALDVARAAGAVLASTSPDYDARFMLPVLRGAVALPTRAYFRVAPGQWRQDGTLAPVPERVVREALHAAPLAIIHGDTTYFGAPRAATTGSLALFPTLADSDGEWYAVDAPPSPLSASLAGIAWDSLPPLSVAQRAPAGAWNALEVARARRFDRRAAIAGGVVAGRRTVVVGAIGFWRWRFRGGESADAYAALWGSIFDWLTAQRPDPRAAFPAEGVLRAGDPVRWRRGSGTDSVVHVVLRRRGAARTDSVTLRFGGGATVAESDPLPAGVYDAQVPGGSAVLVVNASRELLPRGASVRSGAVGGATAFGEPPRLRDQWWAYLLLIAALCAEWLWRRRAGLR